MKPDLQIPIDLIVVGDRLRADLGDINELAESIERYKLIHPIIINQDNHLIAGGRRLAACRLLGWKEIPVRYRETLSLDELRELELEENVRRKDMSWQERVLSIAEIHELKSRNSALAGEAWGYRETGELLGKSLSHVGYSLQIAKLIRSGDEAIIKCTQMTDAIRLLVQRASDDAARRIASSSIKTVATISPTASVHALTNEAQGSVVVPLSNMLICGDSLQWLHNQPDASIDHIVSDPPYAIDMAMLEQENTGMANIALTAEEHQVQPNRDLLFDLIDLAFNKTKPTSFMLLWCDPMLFLTLHDWAVAVGWRVQRWPLVWTKPHTCINQASQYNFTKTVEFVIVLRKPNAVLAKHQPRCHFSPAWDPGEREAFLHPFAKPRAAWKFLLDSVAIQGQTIVDPFAGECSSALACIDLGLSPLCVELKPEHLVSGECLIQDAYRKKFPNVTFL